MITAPSEDVTDDHQLQLPVVTSAGMPIHFAQRFTFPVHFQEFQDFVGY